MEDLTPKDFEIIPAKEKIISMDDSADLGGRIGGMGSTTVKAIDDSIEVVEAIQDSFDANGNLIKEIINAKLDTSSKEILGDFTFGASGAIQIGIYSSGVSGDIKISPAGIVGRNSSNENTFTISGSTGDATFAGALSAVTGTLGALSIASGGNIKQGQTAYDTGTGFWLGDDSGTPKFSIGNPSTESLTWNGSSLQIVGKLKISSNFTLGETVAVRDAVYLKSSDNKVYKTDASANDEKLTDFVGFVEVAGDANDTRRVQTQGIVEGFTGLTIGAYYYLSDTPGAISPIIPGTYGKHIGKAISATQLLIETSDMIFDTEYYIPDSTTLQNSNDTESFTYPGNGAYNEWVKQKETKINESIDKLTIEYKYKPHSTLTGGGAVVRLYKNGVAIGTRKDVNSTSWQTWSEEFTSFNGVANDLIQVYGYSASTSVRPQIKELRLYYRKASKIKRIYPYEDIDTDIVVSREGETISTTNQDPAS